MPFFPPADVVYDLFTVIGPIIGILVGALVTALIHRGRQRRKADSNMQTDVRELREAWLGRDKSLFEPHPPPGGKKRLETVESTLAEHTIVLGGLTTSMEALLTKVTPNGGNTRDLGDIALRIERGVARLLHERETETDDDEPTH